MSDRPTVGGKFRSGPPGLDRSPVRALEQGFTTPWQTRPHPCLLCIVLQEMRKFRRAAPTETRR